MICTAFLRSSLLPSSTSSLKEVITVLSRAAVRGSSSLPPVILQLPSSRTHCTVSTVLVTVLATVLVLVLRLQPSLRCLLPQLSSTTTVINKVLLPIQSRLQSLVLHSQIEAPLSSLPLTLQATIISTTCLLVLDLSTRLTNSIVNHHHRNSSNN